MMSSTRTRSAGGRAHRRNTLEAEDMESPLTTPPSSPVPMEEDSMVDSKIVERHFRVSYTHNHVSNPIIITYFVEPFFSL